VEEGNTVQITKNRYGNKRFNEVKDLDFIKVRTPVNLFMG
jgi:hypothetical protein